MGFIADIGRTLQNPQKSQELPRLQALPEISYLEIQPPLQLPPQNIKIIPKRVSFKSDIVEPQHFTTIIAPLPLSREPTPLPTPIQKNFVGRQLNNVGKIKGGFTDISGFVDKLFSKLIELIKIIIKSVKIGVKFSEFMFIISPFFILVVLLLYVFIILTE